MTLDGFVAGLNGELDWMWIGKQDEAILQDVIELADTCDTILMGRKMTREFIDYWEDVLDNRPENNEKPLAERMVNLQKIIFSHSQTSVNGRNAVMENGDMDTVARALKKQAGKDIMVYGGATFVSSLIKSNLVDEYYIFRKPVAIGNGLSIFKEKKPLELIHSITYKNGTQLNQYVSA